MENKLIRLRKKKLELLREKGIEPYEYRYDVNSNAANVLRIKLRKGEMSKKRVRVAGRIVSLRIMGRASFGHLQDRTGKLQFYFSKDKLRDYDFFKKILDIGDIIGVGGVVFRTKKGEISVYVERLKLLSKSLRGLPEKWHGLRDVELRYRMRYVDLIVNRNVRDVFFRRSEIIRCMREFLEKRGFLDVEVPILQNIYGGAEARPFKTHLNALNIDLFLSISPELYLKRLIVGGLEKVYCVCKNFRNEGIDKFHNPEFTMMECYEAYADYNDMMKLTEEMINYIVKQVLGGVRVKYLGKVLNFKVPWKRMRMFDAIKKYGNLDVENMSDKELGAEVSKLGLGGGSRGEMINCLFEELVEKKLIQPVFITDYPLEICPLVKRHRENPELVERFEGFVYGVEIANAYSELNDPVEQRKRFEEQEELRKRGDKEAHRMDEDFIKALEYGMAPCGGLGIGVDRLVMLLTNSKSIRDVILFPMMRPR